MEYDCLPYYSVLVASALLVNDGHLLAVPMGWRGCTGCTGCTKTGKERLYFISQNKGTVVKWKWIGSHQMAPSLIGLSDDNLLDGADLLCPGMRFGRWPATLLLLSSCFDSPAAGQSH